MMASGGPQAIGDVTVIEVVYDSVRCSVQSVFCLTMCYSCSRVQTQIHGRSERLQVRLLPRADERV